MARVDKNGVYSGSIDNLVYKNYNGQIVVCHKQTTYRDAKAEGQVVYRVKMRNIQNIYAALKESLRGNFQDKTGRQTDYSRFQGINMQKPAVYLNKKEVRFIIGLGIDVFYCHILKKNPFNKHC